MRQRVFATLLLILLSGSFGAANGNVPGVFDPAALPAASWRWGLPRTDILPMDSEQIEGEYVWGARSMNGSFVFVTRHPSGQDGLKYPASCLDGTAYARYAPTRFVRSQRAPFSTGGTTVRAALVTVEAPGSGYDLGSGRSTPTLVRDLWVGVTFRGGTPQNWIYGLHYRGRTDEASDVADYEVLAARLAAFPEGYSPTDLDTLLPVPATSSPVASPAPTSLPVAAAPAPTPEPSGARAFPTASTPEHPPAKAAEKAPEATQPSAALPPPEKPSRTDASGNTQALPVLAASSDNGKPALSPAAQRARREAGGEESTTTAPRAKTSPESSPPASTPPKKEGGSTGEASRTPVLTTETPASRTPGSTTPSSPISPAPGTEVPERPAAPAPAASTPLASPATTPKPDTPPASSGPEPKPSLPENPAPSAPPSAPEAAETPAPSASPAAAAFHLLEALRAGKLDETSSPRLEAIRLGYPGVAARVAERLIKDLPPEEISRRQQAVWKEVALLPASSEEKRALLARFLAAALEEGDESLARAVFHTALESGTVLSSLTPSDVDRLLEAVPPGRAWPFPRESSADTFFALGNPELNGRILAWLERSDRPARPLERVAHRKPSGTWLPLEDGGLLGPILDNVRSPRDLSRGAVYTLEDRLVALDPIRADAPSQGYFLRELGTLPSLLERLTKPGGKPSRKDRKKNAREEKPESGKERKPTRIRP